MFIESILIFLLSLVLVHVVKENAQKFGLVDIPNERSTHVSHTPRGAGIGFYLAVTIVLTLFHYDLVWQYIWTFLAIFFVFSVGVLDDHHDTSHLSYTVPRHLLYLLIFEKMPQHFCNHVDC